MPHGIYYPSVCGNDLPKDTAEIYFDLGVSPYGGKVQLFGVNSNCYLCADTLLSTGEPQVIDTEVAICSQIWTPYPYTLKLLNSTSGEVLVSKDYTFGEKGVYEITLQTNTLKHRWRDGNGAARRAAALWQGFQPLPAP